MRAVTRVKKASLSSVVQLPWDTAEAFSIDYWYEKTHEHLPKVQVRLLYTDEHIHVKFAVREKYVLAQSTELQDPVCKDSCVEFFFSMDGNTYMNYEINCIGTCLCHKRTPGLPAELEPLNFRATDFLIKTSLPQGQAIPEPLECPGGAYTVEFSLPFRFINDNLGGEPPRKGDIWKGNFYKCGGPVERQHWGSWSEMPPTKPNFHRPEFFGDIIFT